MSFNQTFVITTTFVYIDPNTSINLCWWDFYFLSFSTKISITTRHYASSTICTYLHILWAWLSQEREKWKKTIWFEFKFFLFKSDSQYYAFLELKMWYRLSFTNWASTRNFEPVKDALMKPVNIGTDIISNPLEIPHIKRRSKMASSLECDKYSNVNMLT